MVGVRSFLADQKCGRADLIVLVIVALVVGASLVDHDMWFDELQAWGIARSSNGLGDLYGNLRYEGHPPLWHVALFVLTRFTGDPHWLQFLAWVLSMASMVILLFLAPWPRWCRYMVAFGYFFLFEYSVIARSYGLGVFLLLAALVAHRSGNGRLRTLMLCLLAFTSLMGIVISLSFAILFLLQRQMATVMALFTSCAISVVLAMPPGDSAVGAGFGGVFGESLLQRVMTALATPLNGLIPIPQDGRWNTLAIGMLPLWAQVLASIGLVTAISWALTGAARTIWMAGVVGYVAFFGIAYPPSSVRHIGHISLLLIAACWIRPPQLRGRFPQILFVGLLSVQMAVGVQISLRYFDVPFGPNEHIANQVEAFGSEKLLVAQDLLAGIPIGAYLDKPVYTVGTDGPVRFVTYDRKSYEKTKMNTREATVALGETLRKSTGQGVVVLLVGETLVLD